MPATVDANVLIEASNPDSGRHQVAMRVLARLAEGDEILYLFWPVALSSLRVSTHPRHFPRPLTLSVALNNIQHLASLPTVRTGSESSGFLRALAEAALSADAHGKLIHDAHLVALMRQHGVATIWTNDGDFARFPGIRVVDPFA